MTSLKENLDALTASLPDVPAELEALRAQAERVERAVVDFLNELGEKDAQAGARIDELQEALTALGHESEGERAELESDLTAAENRAEASLDELRGNQDRLSQAREAAGAAMLGLKDALAQTGGSVAAAGHDTGQELHDLEEAAGATEEVVRTAFEAAEREVDALRGAVKESCDTVQQATDGLLQRLRAVADQAEHRIDQTAVWLQGFRTAHEAEIPEQHTRLGDGQQAIIDDMRERIAGDLTACITAAADGVLLAFAELQTEGLQAADACQNAHDVLDVGFESLRDAMRPLPDAVGAVKRAAAQLGLSWG